MDKLMEFFIAFLTALSVALGGPVEMNDIPDRPAIVLPTVVPTGADLMRGTDGSGGEFVGAIQEIHDDSIVVDGVTVFLDPQMQGRDELRVGMRVQVRGVKEENGFHAQQILVLHEASSSSRRSSSSASSSEVSRSSSNSSSSSSESSRSSSSESSRSSSSSSESSRSSSSESSRSSSSSSSSESSRSSSSESSRSSSRSSSSESSRSSSSESGK